MLLCGRLTAYFNKETLHVLLPFSSLYIQLCDCLNHLWFDSLPYSPFRWAKVVAFLDESIECTALLSGIVIKEVVLSAVPSQ